VAPRHALTRGNRRPLFAIPSCHSLLPYPCRHVLPQEVVLHKLDGSAGVRFGLQFDSDDVTYGVVKQRLSDVSAMPLASLAFLDVRPSFYSSTFLPAYPLLPCSQAS